METHYEPRRMYKKVVIERTGICYTAWMDYVTVQHFQPRFWTIKDAKAAINAR